MACSRKPKRIRWPRWDARSPRSIAATSRGRPAGRSLSEKASAAEQNRAGCRPRLLSRAQIELGARSMRRRPSKSCETSPRGPRPIRCARLPASRLESCWHTGRASISAASSRGRGRFFEKGGAPFETARARVELARVLGGLGRRLRRRRDSARDRRILAASGGTEPPRARCVQFEQRDRCATQPRRAPGSAGGIHGAGARSAASHFCRPQQSPDRPTPVHQRTHRPSPRGQHTHEAERLFAFGRRCPGGTAGRAVNPQAPYDPTPTVSTWMARSGHFCSALQNDLFRRSPRSSACRYITWPRRVRCPDTSERCSSAQSRQFW